MRKRKLSPLTFAILIESKSLAHLKYLVLFKRVTPGIFPIGHSPSDYFPSTSQQSEIQTRHYTRRNPGHTSPRKKNFKKWIRA